MEQIKQAKTHLLSMENRKKLTMTGVEKVITSSETSLALLTSYGAMTVTGSGLVINKFNAEDGSLTVEGTIDIIKYSGQKVPVLKRIFK